MFWIDVEIWKPSAHENYLVSNHGRVKRIDSGRILTPKLNPDGYVIADLCAHGEVKRWRVHRLVALAFLENPEGKPHVNHLDSVKTNNHWRNLQWVTAAENNAHMHASGRREKDMPSRRLTPLQRKAIKILRLEGTMTHEQIGEVLNLERRTVYEAAHSAWWKST